MGEILRWSPQYMTATCANTTSLAAFCRVMAKIPQRTICQVERKTVLKQRRKHNFRRTFSPNIAKLQ